MAKPLKPILILQIKKVRGMLHKFSQEDILQLVLVVSNFFDL